MKSFVVPSNPKFYNVRKAFDELKTVHWVQGRNKSVKKGDYIYIYESAPTSAIVLKTKVVERDVNNYHIDDKKFTVGELDFSEKGPWFTLEKVREISPPVSLSHLHKIGMSGSIQTLREINQEIIDFLEKKIIFRKIKANDNKIIEVRNRLKAELDCFADYLDRLSTDKGYKGSGVASSYPLYLARMIVVYEENRFDKIEVLETFESFFKIDTLRESPEFIKYNKDEGRFPNAAINGYMDYLLNLNNIIEQQNDDKLNEELLYIKNNRDLTLIKGPTKPKKSSTLASVGYERSIDESLNAKISANWACEYNKNHQTFISKTNGKPYTEAHHLIPMAAQDLYENSLDFSDNIISLCPTCHRLIHFGMSSEKEKMIVCLFNKRKNLYHKYGIEISISKLKEFYSIY